MLVDSHCHIPLIESPEGSQAVIHTALASGIGHMLCVSIDLDSFPDLVSLAEAHSCISISVGVHPNTVVAEEPSAAHLARLASHPKVVAIGETGLDYFRSRGDLDWQRQRFRRHIQAAFMAGKPLIIHSRDAREDVISILKQEAAAEVGGVMHCYTDDWETALRYLDMNFYISFAGIVTFKNALALQEAARNVPLDRLLIETDAPYLAPVPYRGKQNQPAYVRHVAECIAELRGLAWEDIAVATTENFRRLFRNAQVNPGIR
jgi:TatD DNase family protein